MTLLDRADAFNVAYRKWPASHLHVVKEQGRDVLYGRWVIGNNYRNKTRFYGEYPAGYLDRVHALFPDVLSASRVLHVFSGSMPPGRYHRCDLRQPAEYRCSVYDLPNAVGLHRYFLLLSDPPYSEADAVHYGTPAVDRRRATAALAQVTEPGGFLVWLDTCWPMHRKTEWMTVGRVVLTRSTNHRVRDVTIFQRQG